MRNQMGTRIIKPILAMIALVLLAVLARAADNKPTPADAAPAISSRKLSELEIEKFKRMQLQLAALRRQYEDNAAPTVNEQTALLNKVCGDAKIEVKDCRIDIDSGAISKVQVVPDPAAVQGGGAPPAKAAK